MAAHDVLTLAEAKAAINVTGVTTYDSELPAWITGVSELLDRHVGPIVQRAVTDEAHDGASGVIRTRLYPVAAWTSVTEYSGGVATVLTAETNLLQPASSYLAGRYGPDPTLYSGVLWRREAGYAATYATGVGNVVVSYIAGRYANTAAVTELFKRAAALTLQNIWNAQRPSLAQVGDFEIPQSNWPRFAIPNAVQEMLASEWQGALMVG